MPLSFLASRTRAVANGTTFLFSAAFYAMVFLLMIHVQTVLGYGPLKAGVAYLPYCAGMLAGMWLSSRAVIRLGMRRTLVTSFLISSAGLLLLSGGGAVGVAVLVTLAARRSDALTDSTGPLHAATEGFLLALIVAAALLALGAAIIATLLAAKPRCEIVTNTLVGHR